MRWLFKRGETSVPQRWAKVLKEAMDGSPPNTITVVTCPWCKMPIQVISSVSPFGYASEHRCDPKCGWKGELLLEEYTEL